LSCHNNSFIVYSSHKSNRIYRYIKQKKIRKLEKKIRIHKCQILHTAHTRGVQKVRRPTQLSTRYAHHILSLFDIFSCNSNALGPVFLLSSHSVVEELLFLVFQPTICHEDRFVRNFVSIHEFFQFRKKQKSLGARTTYLITCQLKHWLPSKMLALNYSVTIRIRIAQ